MKIRIHNNSLRYRLRQPDVELFKTEGTVTETISFGNAALHFSLTKTPSSEIQLTHSNNITTILVPARIAENWTDTEAVGFDAMLTLQDGVLMKILVEKDFKCIDGNEEDQVGTYPNPAEHC